MLSFKKKSTKITILSLLIIGSFLVASNLLAVESNATKAFSGFNTMIKWAYGGGQDVNVGQTTFASTLVGIINLLLSFLGVIFFLLMIYAGYLWMTSRGNDEQVNKAKKIIREAITAIIIILIARVFTEFLLLAIGRAIETA